MRALHFLRNHAVAITCVALVGLNVWVVSQMLDTRGQSFGASGHQPLMPIVIPAPTATASLMPIHEDPSPPSFHSSVASTAALPKLRQGMTRAEVEQLLGTPPADHIQAVTLSSDRITYQTVYEVIESNLPLAVRARTTRAMDFQPLVALEFDASKPGHPLLGIHYADPLF